MPGDWPLVGRTEELRLLAERPAGAVLAGAAGVGKTRLAREMVANAGASVVTRWVTATASARDLPFGAFGAVLDGVLPPAANLLGHAVEAVRTGARPSGTLVAVDDAHLLDDHSAAVVHQLVVRGVATVVLTLRSGEPTPDAITALWKDGHLPRLELQPLSAVETTVLLEAVLQGAVERSVARRLWELTQGNALYLRELVAGEQEAGRLRPLDGLWLWSGRPTLSPGLAELVQARIGSLSDAERDVVELLAFGEPLDPALLCKLAGNDAVERAEVRGLVVVDVVRDEVRLAHPLFGEVQRARCGVLRARRLRGRIAEALAGAGGAQAEVLRRGVLAMESDLTPDPDLLTVAARTAAGRADARLAERLARAAIAAGGGFAPRLTLASVIVGHAGGADEELAELTANARTDTEHVQAAALQVDAYAFMTGRPELAGAVLARAQGAVAGRAASTELDALRAAVDAFRNGGAATAALAAATLAEPGLSDSGVAHASWALVAAHGLRGRLDGLELAEQSGVAAARRSLDLGWMEIPIRAWHGMALLLAGRLAEVELIGRELTERFGEMPLANGACSLVNGRVALTRGHVAEALRLLREARAGLAPFGPAGGWMFACLADMTIALAQSGSRGPARQTFAELAALPPTGLAALAVEGALAAAWVEAADGALSTAVAHTRHAAELAADRGAQEVMALHTAVRFGDRTSAERLAALATRVDGPFAAVAAAHAAGLATDNGAALTAASREFEEIGVLQHAADAAAHAAAAYTRKGLRGSARTAAARATALAERCPGASSPALRGAATPLPFTEREREIAMLVAAGLTNQAIATRLTVSVRTVEGHIYRACGKVGVNDRAALAALLRDGSER
ncbi:LuxR C-terminal-related transcriptional regulator [Pseudonocardia aurantiaca]|uniref:LuxR C-terminal-related transcriptional regulator n=1 Tax=Pseudonocardia aurantiaca TaxID=75290 RepID=A0ABW4FCW5_9PSEU